MAAKLTLLTLATALGLPETTGEDEVLGKVRALTSLSTEIETVRGELAHARAAQSAAETARRIAEASVAALQAPPAKSADPEPEKAASKFKVGDKALLGDQEVEITDVLPEQTCYIAKAGEQSICAPESMLKPLAADVAAVAKDHATALTSYAKIVGSKMAGPDVERLAMRLATGAVSLTGAMEQIQAQPTVPAGALEALRPRMPDGVAANAGSGTHSLAEARRTMRR